ncbi:MAG: hypothetical protein JNM57_13595 [Cyclobacteriaceae bacterium]|nr:hypothetical protein [Cyclobacteriaceae bacterium]
MRKNILFILLLMISPGVFGQSESTDKQAVLLTVQKFFDAMTAHDSLGASQVLLQDGNYWATRQEATGTYSRMNTFKTFTERIQRDTTQLDESMWNPTVLIRQTIAMVWTPYQIKISNKLAHCGIDSFSLIKTSEGWKISHLIFTMEPNGCSEMKKYKIEDHLR